MTDIDELLPSQMSDDELVANLSADDNNLADFCAYELHARKAIQLVERAILDNVLKKKVPRQRGLNLINWWGKKSAKREAIYRHVFENYTHNLYSNALFGIVFSRYLHMIPLLVTIANSNGLPSDITDDIMLAIRALEANDPAIYSPGYRDTNGVW